jgi:hypothetical protein
MKYFAYAVLFFVLAGCAALPHEPLVQNELSILGKWEHSEVGGEYVSLNRDYEWYIDQKYTGYSAETNCGPTCAIMAAKWSDKDFSKSVEDARFTFRENGGWWYIRNIYNFLTYNDIPCFVDNLISPKNIEKHLNNGNILIVNINTKYIPYNRDAEQRTGKYYNLNTGHFIIIKGYRAVDENIFFEVYDPNTWDMFYADGTPKGKDRYYLFSSVLYSMSKWEKKYIVVSQK